jgi:hypothetical protein
MIDVLMVMSDMDLQTISCVTVGLVLVGCILV